MTQTTHGSKLPTTDAGGVWGQITPGNKDRKKNTKGDMPPFANAGTKRSKEKSKK